MTTKTDEIARQLEEAVALATPGQWYFDDNLGLSVSSDSGLDLTMTHTHGRNGENDMRFVSLCSPENIMALLAERRALLVTQERLEIGSDGIQRTQQQRDNLVMMVKLLCRTVKKYNPGSMQAKDFIEYMQREGLISTADILRAEPGEALVESVRSSEDERMIEELRAAASAKDPE